MNWICDNWYVVVSFMALALAVLFAILDFFKLPTNKQIANVKEWLKWAVTEAETKLGSGTGQLKLRMVYDMAIAKFPWIAKFIDFETFSKWVDESLEWLNKQLESNTNVKLMVKG